VCGTLLATQPRRLGCSFLALACCRKRPSSDGLVPRQKFFLLRLMQLIYVTVRDVGRGTHKVHILRGVEEVKLPRFLCRETECLGQFSEWHGQVIKTIQPSNILNLHAHDLLTVHEEEFGQKFILTRRCSTKRRSTVLTLWAMAITLSAHGRDLNV
jgi:hypothetical protein